MGCLGKGVPWLTENRKLMVTATLMPAARVSSVWISEGTSQPRGPQDQANPAEAGGRAAGFRQKKGGLGGTWTRHPDVGRGSH